MKSGWENKTFSEVLEVLRNGINCKQSNQAIGDKISRIKTISNANFDIEKVGYATLHKNIKDKYRLKIPSA